MIRLLLPLKSIELKPDNPAHEPGRHLQDLGNLDQALASHSNPELNPNNPTAHMNLGCIYKDLGNLDQALASTLKSSSSNLITPLPT